MEKLRLMIALNQRKTNLSILLSQQETYAYGIAVNIVERIMYVIGIAVNIVLSYKI